MLGLARTPSARSLAGRRPAPRRVPSTLPSGRTSRSRELVAEEPRAGTASDPGRTPRPRAAGRPTTTSIASSRRSRGGEDEEADALVAAENDEAERAATRRNRAAGRPAGRAGSRGAAPEVAAARWPTSTPSPIVSHPSAYAENRTRPRAERSDRARCAARPGLRESARRPRATARPSRRPGRRGGRAARAARRARAAPRARQQRRRSRRTARTRAGRACRRRRGGGRDPRSRPRRGSRARSRRAPGSARSCAPRRRARRAPPPGSRSPCRRRAPLAFATWSTQRSCSQMSATMYGCEIVCPSPIGSAASAYAPSRSSRRDEELARHASHRGEHALVLDAAPRGAATRPSAPARQRHRQAPPSTGTATPKCASTAGATSVIRASSAVDPDGHDRHERVACDERAVAPAARVMAAAEVGELPALRGRDEQLAGVRIRERRACAPGGIRVLELLDRAIRAVRDARRPRPPRGEA